MSKNNRRPLPKDSAAMLLDRLGLTTPSPDVMFDEILEKAKEGAQHHPKMKQIFKALGTNKMLEMEGYIAAGFTREEAFMLLLVKERR